MKNSKGQTLEQPYLDLALMRREQQGGNGHYIDRTDCFNWELVPEKGRWWYAVSNGETPEIPASSLAELEAWRKAKLIDYKTMYEDLLDKLEFYKKAFEGLKTTVEQNLHTAELQSTERNYVWEAALAIYAANRVMGIEYAFDKANEFVAEGKKRNHI